MFPRDRSPVQFPRRAGRNPALRQLRPAIRPHGRRPDAAGHRGHREHHRRQPASQPRAAAAQFAGRHRRIQTPHLARTGGTAGGGALRHRRGTLAPDRPDAVRRLPESPSGDESRRTRRHGGQRPRNRRRPPVRPSNDSAARPPSAAPGRRSSTGSKSWNGASRPTNTTSRASSCWPTAAAPQGSPTRPARTRHRWSSRCPTPREASPRCSPYSPFTKSTSRKYSRCRSSAASGNTASTWMSPSTTRCVTGKPSKRRGR